MAIQYEWAFRNNALKTKNEGSLNDVVSEVKWFLKATENSRVFETQGTEKLPLPSPDNFTPFSDLTQSQVAGWIESNLGEEKVNHYKAILADKINNSDDLSGFVFRPFQEQKKNPWDGEMPPDPPVAQEAIDFDAKMNLQNAENNPE